MRTDQTVMHDVAGPLTGTPCDRADDHDGGPLVITGANGYIGREVVRIARAAGFEVRVLVRRPGSSVDSRLRIFPYVLGDEPPEEALEGASVLIHLAVDTTGRGDSHGDANIVGTLRLREASRRKGVRRFVFVSSQSAAPSALSTYGRSKWRIEQSLDGPDEIVVRPGMVYGGPERGLYGMLCRLISALPLVPVIRGSAPLYPIHVEDLAHALIKLSTGPVPAERIICLGAARSISLSAFLEQLGKARLGRKPWLLPVPTALLLALLTPLTRFSLQAAYLCERLRGIQALPAMDTAAGLRAAEISLRPLDLKSTHRVSAQRVLLREGVALLRYVFGSRVSRFTARRWLRLLPVDAEPLRLPGLLTTQPGLLRLIEPLPLLPRGPRAVELSKRLHLALVVGEICGRSSAVLTQPRHTGQAAALLDLATAGLLEAAAMAPRLLVHLAWWRR